MTYIPIPTQTKDKFVYVPVNSLQPGQNGQQILFYPQNQQLKDANGKQVILSPQIMHTTNKSLLSTPKTENNDTPNTQFTTVRIQGVSQGGIMPKTPNTPVSLQPKTFKYQFGGSLGYIPNSDNNNVKTADPVKITIPNDPLIKKSEVLNELKDIIIKKTEPNNLNNKDDKEVKKTLAESNDQLTDVKNEEELVSSSSKKVLSSSSTSEVNTQREENSENITPPLKNKRKRGRPPCKLYLLFVNLESFGH